MGLEIIIYGLYSLQQNNSIDQHHPWENDLAPGLKLHLLEGCGDSLQFHKKVRGIFKSHSV